MPNLKTWKTRKIRVAIKKFNQKVVRTAKVVAEANSPARELKEGWEKYLSTIDNLYPLRYNREDYKYPMLDELEVTQTENLPDRHIELNELSSK